MRVEQALKESPVLRLMIPFYKTPMNLLKFVPRRTPLLWRLSEKVQADIQAGGARKAQANARIVTGTMMWTAAAALYAAGHLTGKHDADEKNTMMNAGIPEYAIKNPLTGKMVQYHRFSPFGMFLGLVTDAGNLARRASDPDFDGVYSQLVLIAGNNILANSWATTLSDMFLLYKEPARYGESFFKKYASTFHPMGGFARSVNDYIDPHMRESRTFVDGLQNTYWSQANAERLDDFGKDIHKSIRWFGSTSTQVREDSPIRMEMAHLHIPTQMPKDQTLGADMTNAQFYEFRKLLDSPKINMEANMNKVVLRPEYQAASFPIRKGILTRLRNNLHMAARMTLLKQDKGMRLTFEAQLEAEMALLKQKGPPLENPVKDFGKFLTEGRVNKPIVQSLDDGGNPQ